MPDAFGPAGLDNYKYSIYCNYKTNSNIKSLEITKHEELSEKKGGTADVVLYPNPVKTTLNLEVNEIDDLQNLILTIYTIQGNPIRSLNINSNISQINVTDLSNGIYIVVLKDIITGNIYKSTRIIKNQ